MLPDTRRPSANVTRVRPMGNAQARQPGLPPSPAYGNTTNVTGAQTASRMATAGAGAATMAPFAGAASAGQGANPFGPVQPPASAAAAPYAGGDVAGISQYYRNQAVQNYQGGQPSQGSLTPQAMVMGALPMGSPMGMLGGSAARSIGRGNSMLAYPPGSPNPNTPNPIAPAAAEAQANAAFMRANPGIGTSSLDATQRFGRMTANNAFQSSMVNGYVGQANVPQPFDENAARARALETMRGGAAADPTNMAGRMGSFGATGLADQIANDRRAAADAEREKIMASPGYQQRMGDLRARQTARNADPAYQARMAEAAKERETRAQSFRDANDGMSPRQLRRREQSEMRIERRLRDGVINEPMAQLQRERLERQRPAPRPAQGLPPNAPDRTRLPNNQLPESTRQAAATTAANMTNPAYNAPTPEFRKQSEIVQTIGLRDDMNAPLAASTIVSTPVPTDPAAQKEYVRALRKYWGAMRDKDSNWSANSTLPTINALNQLAELPEDKIDSWISTWQSAIGEVNDMPAYSPFMPLFGPG